MSIGLLEVLNQLNFENHMNYKLKQFKGEIVPGRGMGKGTIESMAPFFKERQIDFFPGTLNLVFNNPVFLDEAKATYRVNKLFYFWEAKINGIECFAYRWRKCPAHIIEIVAKERLRDKPELRDTQTVQLEVRTDQLSPYSLWRIIYWNLAWRGRCRIYYTNDTYFLVISLIEAAVNRLKRMILAHSFVVPKHNT